MLSRSSVLIMILLLTTSLAIPALADGGHHDHGAHSHGDQPAAFDGMVEDYLAIQTSLAGDSIEGVDEHAAAITKSARALSDDFDLEATGVESKNAAALLNVLPGLAESAADLSEAKDIKSARASFATLSDAMIAYRKLVTGDAPNVAYCPMVKHNWLQNGKKIANPYLGSKMLRCGSIVDD